MYHDRVDVELKCLIIIWVQLDDFSVDHVVDVLYHGFFFVKNGFNLLTTQNK